MCRRLSPTFTSFLDKLDATHSSAKMINHTRLTGGLVRKDPVDTVHPLVRVHPVTGEKCLFFNGEFITRIEGMKVPEQKWLLDFLMNHVATGHDFQARVRWQPKTIVIFDNRSTIRKFPCLISFQKHKLTIRQTPLLSTTSTTTTAPNSDISSVSARWARDPCPLTGLTTTTTTPTPSSANNLASLLLPSSSPSFAALI